MATAEIRAKNPAVDGKYKQFWMFYYITCISRIDFPLKAKHRNVVARISKQNQICNDFPNNGAKLRKVNIQKKEKERRSN